MLIEAVTTITHEGFIVLIVRASNKFSATFSYLNPNAVATFAYFAIASLLNLSKPALFILVATPLLSIIYPSIVVFLYIAPESSNI
ncbi:MAG: hypothetical protein ACRC41_09770 [Sarcina sp.]